MVQKLELAIKRVLYIFFIIKLRYMLPVYMGKIVFILFNTYCERNNKVEIVLINNNYFISQRTQICFRAKNSLC